MRNGAKGKNWLMCGCSIKSSGRGTGTGSEFELGARKWTSDGEKIGADRVV